ncbi:UBN2 domain-containing protein [Cephalotus follicularis]|uniref:UBN2 domain-containing protein n=1 Tax=Cephalotus follicularis TaxID=3775 RepID=A0A1Q3CUU4_CEPFO|nr:UBN2 domain-containing protein [Cephalotus follicularis]
MQLWNVLTEAFLQASEAREFELQSKIQFHTKTDTMSITEYLTKFKTIFDQLYSIGKPVPDQRKVFLLFTNLGPTYEAFSITMLKPHIPSYSDIPLLHSHELRSKHNKSASAINHSMAFTQIQTTKGRNKEVAVIPLLPRIRDLYQHHKGTPPTNHTI